MIVGLDLSVTRTGIALWRGSGVERMGLDRTLTLSWARAVAEGAGRGPARLQWYRDEIMTLLGGRSAGRKEWDPAKLVVIEGYSYGAKGAGVYQLAEMGGVVRLALYEQGMRYVEVPPASLKKFVTGRGNAAKDEVRLGMYKRFGVEAATNDEIDAAGLALMGAFAMGHLQMDILPKQNREALEGIEWPTL